MANCKDLTVTVNANLTVSDETAERCLRILEMWQSDNPDRKIEGEWMEHNRVQFRIVPFRDEPMLKQEVEGDE